MAHSPTSLSEGVVPERNLGGSTLKTHRTVTFEVERRQTSGRSGLPTWESQGSSPSPGESPRLPGSESLAGSFLGNGDRPGSSPPAGHRLQLSGNLTQAGHHKAKVTECSLRFSEAITTLRLKRPRVISDCSEFLSRYLDRISSHLKMVQTGQEARLYDLTRFATPGVLLPRLSVHGAVEKVMLECPKIPSSSILTDQVQWDSVAGVGSGNDVQQNPGKFSAHSVHIQCICGNRQPTLNDRLCVGGCGATFHVACMGKGVRVCVQCRLRTVDPFWEPLPVSEGGIEPISPARLTSMSYGHRSTGVAVCARRTFRLTHSQKARLAAGNRSQGKPGGRFQMHATCFQINDKVLHRVHWPTRADLVVNSYRLQCYSRFSDQQLGPNGRDASIDISQYLVLGENSVLLTSNSPNYSTAFVLVLRMVRSVELEKVERNLLSRYEGTSPSDGGVARAKQILGVGGDGEDEDDDLVATSTIVPLRCPLSAMRIETPARSKVCSHLKVFDLHSFLRMNSRSQKWQCPFCMRSAHVGDLEVDLYLQGILAAVKRLPGNDEVDEVEVRPSDLSWRAYYGKIKGGGKWVAVGQEPGEDALQGGEAKAALTLGQVKPEPGGDGSKPNVNGEAAPAPSISEESLSEGEEMRRAAEAARGLKRPRPVAVIDLSDSEDEAKPAPPRRQSEGTASTGAGARGPRVILPGTAVRRYQPTSANGPQFEPNCDCPGCTAARRLAGNGNYRRTVGPENNNNICQPPPTANPRPPRQGTARNPLDL